MWSRSFKCSVKTYATGVSIECYSIPILLHVGPTTRGLWDSQVSCSPGFELVLSRATALRWSWRNSGKPQNIIYWCHVGPHIGFVIYSNFLGHQGHRPLVWNEVGWVLALSTKEREILDISGQGPSSSRVKVALSMKPLTIFKVTGILMFNHHPMRKPLGIVWQEYTSTVDGTKKFVWVLV